MLVKIALSPSISASFRTWGVRSLQQFLSHPVVFPIWLALMFGLGFYFGGRLMLWLLRKRRNQGNQDA